MARKRYLALIGLFLFLFILLQLNVGQIMQILFSANLFYVILAFCCNLVVTSMKGIKWRLMINAHGRDISLYDSIRFYYIGFFISTLTPGRVGEFMKAFYVREKMPLAVALSTVVLDRLVDISLLIALGSVSIIAFAYLFGVIIIPLHILLLVIAAFVAFVLVLLRGRYIKVFVNPVIEHIVPLRFKDKLRASLGLFYSSFKQALKRRSIIAVTVLMAIFYWFITMLFAYFIALAVNIPLPFHFIALFVPIITLIDLIPISISSIGTRDAALIFFFAIYSIPAESAVAFSLIYLFLGYILVSLIGAAFFARNPIDFNVLGEKPQDVSS